MPPSEMQIHITWRQEPPLPAQLAAWDRLWRRLLDNCGAGKKREPHEDSPGAVDGAAAANGNHIVSEHANNITHYPRST